MGFHSTAASASRSHERENVARKTGNSTPTLFRGAAFLFFTCVIPLVALTAFPSGVGFTKGLTSVYQGSNVGFSGYIADTSSKSGLGSIRVVRSGKTEKADDGAQNNSGSGTGSTTGTEKPPGGSSKPDSTEKPPGGSSKPDSTEKPPGGSSKPGSTEKDPASTDGNPPADKDGKTGGSPPDVNASTVTGAGSTPAKVKRMRVVRSGKTEETPKNPPPAKDKETSTRMRVVRSGKTEDEKGGKADGGKTNGNAPPKDQAGSAGTTTQTGSTSGGTTGSGTTGTTGSGSGGSNASDASKPPGDTAGSSSSSTNPSKVRLI